MTHAPAPRRLACLAILFSLLCSIAPADPESVAGELSVASPDGAIRLTFSLEAGGPRYSVNYRGKPLLAASRLGFELTDAPSLGSGFDLLGSSRQSVDETWEQPWGECREIRCAYNELRVELRQSGPLARRMDIVFRLFDDGLGLRYEWPEQPNLVQLNISDELTEFVFACEPHAWWIPAYQREHYEYLYRRTPLSEVQTAHTPITLETPDGPHVCIHEAALVNFSSMSLRSDGERALKADLAPWSDGVRVRAATPHHSPWRTVQIAEEAGGLVTSYLGLNLNEPCKLADTSWITPGKYVGIWWEMHLGVSTWGSGEKHGATTANTKRYLDFAAEHGFDGVLVEGWNRGWNGDWIRNGNLFSFTKPYPDFDLEGLAEYAHTRGVRLIGHHETGGATENYEQQLDDAFALYERLGVRAVKTGYVNYANGLPRSDESGSLVGEWHYGQYMVRHHQRVIESAARHHLMLDIHEPVKQTGLRRTYPNYMTAEGARGQEYNAWSADGGNPPEHTTILPFTRLLAGPMDFTPGIFDLTYPEARPDNRVNTTLAKQLALYIVLYSPLQMAADLPENYQSHLDAFQFIKDTPTDWEATRVLTAEIGDHVTIARRERDGDDWFLGSITDENPRELEVSLDFLAPGRRYTAQVYRDADDANWKGNPTAYTIETVQVDSQQTLTLKLAPGGGQAIRFVAE